MSAPSCGAFSTKNGWAMPAPWTPWPPAYCPSFWAGPPGVSFASEGEKEYVAGLKLGLVTNTQDTSGEVLEQHPVSVTPEELEAVLPAFPGRHSAGASHVLRH